jgi:hypothetical protein
MIEVFIFYLIISKHLNLLQMSRYSTYGEQRFRQQFDENYSLTCQILMKWSNNTPFHYFFSLN